MKESSATQDGPLIGTRPRPRMLIMGFEDVDLVQRLVGLVPTSRVIETPDEVRQDEFDLIVTTTSLEYWSRRSERVRISSHLSALLVGDNAYITIERMPIGDPVTTVSIESRKGHICGELRPPSDDLEPETGRLVARELVPMAMRRESHMYFLCQAVQSTGADRAAADNVLFPFLLTATGRVLAGRYARSADAECWLIPPDVPDIVSWVAQALRRWHGLFPERFPRTPGWQDDPRWKTAAELQALRRLEEAQRRRAEAIAEHDTEVATLAAELARLADAADVEQRRLFFAQGAQLVDVVMSALVRIGFEVTEMDRHHNRGDLLEDLRVTDPDDPEWICLAEIRGYKGGASLNDLLRIARFGERYVAETHTVPSARWYVVNQFAGQDPSGRGRPLANHPNEVATFAGTGGLVVDTVYLFEALRAVDEDPTKAEEVRWHLKRSTGWI
jgi:hypothetical protein